MMGIEHKDTHTIYVKFHSKYAKPLIIAEKGDWIDLRFCGILKYQDEHIPIDEYFSVSKDPRNNKIYYHFKQGDCCILSLGISCKLPPDYEAYIAPRSSTFIRHGIIMGNSFGIIDNSYSGTNDIWGFIAYFTRPVRLFLGERIAQFRIQKNMPKSMINLIEVDALDDNERGGYGSTGVE